MTPSEILREQRELSKLGLQSFFLDLENNSYDSVSDEVIILQEKKIKDLEIKISKNNGHSTEYVYDDWEMIFLQQELKALVEMKILYAFKNFEIKLKFLLGASYGNTNKNLFKWDYVVEFLKAKQIDVKKLNSYLEINELRNVNNSIKHSNNLINNNTDKIKEFKNKKNIQYHDILKFYKRIETSPRDFLSSLSDFIFKDLYEFDENRIEKIAEKISLRMEEKEVNILIEKLKSKY